MARGAHRTHPDGLMLKDIQCSVEMCDSSCRKGMWLEDFSPLCHMHATRWRRTGDPLAVKSTRGRAYGVDREKDLERRFLNDLVMGERSADGLTRHLLFTGFLTDRGYGRLGTMKDGKFFGVLAHRYAWEHWIGPLSDDLDLDHRSECPKNCVNPAHLTPLTKSEHCRIENLRTPDHRRGGGIKKGITS